MGHIIPVAKVIVINLLILHSIGGLSNVHDSGSSGSVAEASPLSSPRHSQMVTSTYAVKRGPSGYGMILKAIRVYIGQTDDYRIHHIIEVHVAC